MEVFPDFEEWLVCLNSANAEYVVIGGYAVAHHGHPRYTHDLDVFYRVTPENIGRVIEALNAFGFGSLGLTTDDLGKPGTLIQLGNPPAQIDLLNRVTGLTWEEAARDLSLGVYGDTPTQYLGLRALLQNKRATGRAKDLADIEELDR